MSVINRDSETAADRKHALTDVDAPLRDRIVAKLLSKCNDLEVGKIVSDLWYLGNADRVNWHERQKAYLALFDEHLVGDTENPLSGSSQLHIPMPLIVLKTFHARMYQAIMGVDPPFHTRARNEASMPRCQTVTDTMRYYIHDGANYGKGIEDVIDRWIWDWAGLGEGIKKWRWDARYERFIDVIESDEPGDPIVVKQNGRDVAVPSTKTVERESVVTKKTFEGPVCELVNPEDFLVVGGSGDPDHPEANVLHRQFLTASELWTAADRKVFDSDVVQQIIEGGPNMASAAIQGDIKTQRSIDAGQATTDDERLVDRYEIIEAYLRKDVDGSGIDSSIVVWVHLKSRNVLRATYLRRVSPSGERPFSKAEFLPRKGQQHPVGLLELLYPLSREMDAMHNMRIDFGLLSTMPFGFYRASSSIDPATIKLEPGALIPVDNPATDVMFPNLGNRTVFGMQEEQAIQTMVERLTSISDTNLGVIGGQGITRTATGSKVYNSEMSSNLDIFLKRLNRGWKKSLRLLLHMLQKRVPVGLSFRISGDDGQDYWTVIRTAKDLEGDFDVEVTPNSETSNKQVQIDKAQQVLQMTLNPLYIQMGLVGAPQLFEAAKNFYQALDIKDWRRFLVKQDPNAAYSNLTPEQEANMILHGIDVPVLPPMDHQGFLAFFKLYHDTDELNGQFGPEQMIAMAKQARKHQQMLQALQAQQAQAANIQQQQQNAAQSGQNPNIGGLAAGPQGQPVMELRNLAPADIAPQPAPGTNNLTQ